MKCSVAALCAVVVMAVATPVLAHHSFSAVYDGNKPVTIRGKVSRLGWLNPHTHLYVDVVNQKGETMTWEIETASTLSLTRAGMRKEDFIGEEAIVTGFLARDGTPTMTASKFTLVNKKKEFTSDELAPAARP